MSSIVIGSIRRKTRYMPEIHRKGETIMLNSLFPSILLTKCEVCGIHIQCCWKEDYISMRFSEVIKQTRQKAFLSQEEFSKERHVSVSTINRWEQDWPN